MLELPLIVVARMALGTINHTLLTLREVERRGLALAGVILSEANGPLSDADQKNLEHLRRELGELRVGEIADTSQSQRSPKDSIDLDRLLSATG